MSSRRVVPRHSVNVGDRLCGGKEREGQKRRRESGKGDVSLAAPPYLECVPNNVSLLLKLSVSVLKLIAKSMVMLQ